MSARIDPVEVRYPGFGWEVGDDGTPRIVIRIDPVTKRLVFPDGSPDIVPPDEFEAYKVELNTLVSAIAAAVAGASGITATTVSFSILDYSYVYRAADGGIIAYHGPGQPAIIDTTDPESIELARRFLDAKYAGDYSVLGYEKIERGSDGKVFKAYLPGRRPRIKGVNNYLAHPYTEGFDSKDWPWAIGSNQLDVPSLFAPRSPYKFMHTGYGQSLLAGAANGDMLNVPFSSPARDAAGLYTMANATGGTLIRAATTDAAFDSPNIRDLEGIDYLISGQRIVSETVFPEMFHQIGRLQEAAMGFKTPMHIVASGRGGYSINWLKPGAPQYKAILRQHAIDREFAIAAGDIPIPGAIFWLQGEEDYDTPFSELVQAYHCMFERLHRDICAIYGVHMPLKVITYCPLRGPFGSGGSDVCRSTRAYFELMKLYPGSYAIAGPTYAVEHAPVDYHPTIKGYRQFGAMLARAFFDLVMGFGPSLPMHVDQSAKVIRVAADEFLLPIYVPRGATILRQAGTTPIGNPVSNAASNYIGGAPSGDVRFARDGGIWCFDHAGASIGVIQSAAGGDIPGTVTSAAFSGSQLPLWVKLASVPARNGATINIAGFSQSGAAGGDQLDGARSLYYASSAADFEIAMTYDDADFESFPTRLCPQQVELPL